MNQAQMMAQVRKMQENMEKAQAELARTVVRGEAAGGLVVVEMTCEYEPTGVKISPEAIDPEDPSMLEDLVRVAVAAATKAARETAAKRMEALTGGLKIPGLT